MKMLITLDNWRKMAETATETTTNATGKRGPYRKSKKAWDLAHVRHLIVSESLTDYEIADKLQIPLRTVERYKKEIFLKEPDLLEIGMNESLMIDMKICYEKFAWTEQEIKERLAAIPKDELTSEVLDAHNLLLDLAWYIPRIKRASPARAAELLRELTGNGK
jgi:hypothetical protein